MTESAAGQPPPPSRYGRTPMAAPTRRRVTNLLGALTVVIALGLATLVYQRFESAAVEGSTAAFVVLVDGSETAGAIGVMAMAVAPTRAVVPAIICERSEICIFLRSSSESRH